MITILLLLVPIIASLMCPGPNQGWQTISSSLPYTTVTQIINADLHSVCPTINSTKVPILTPEEYLLPNSCLGLRGPLGPMGPLGFLGPLKNKFWNPTIFTQMKAQWPFLNFAYSGTLDKDGPLGHKGPLATEQYYGMDNPGKQLFEENDFSVQLRSFGLWASLGPLGPLGALGPLGPLGPFGAHGLEIDLQGNYRRNGKIVKQIEVDYDGKITRTYPLVEFHSSEYAESNRLDTSFIVQGQISVEKQETIYKIDPQDVDQIVTIVLTSLNKQKNFSMSVYSTQTHGLITGSAEELYIQSTQLALRGNQGIIIKVRALFSGSTGGFRLSVVGSTQYLNKFNISGPHLKYSFAH